MGGVITIMKEHLEKWKTCLKCGLKQPLSEFSKKRTKNGKQKHMPYCKECDAIRQREQRNGKFKEYYNEPDLDASKHCAGCFYYEERTTSWWFGKCYSLCIKKS